MRRFFMGWIWFSVFLFILNCMQIWILRFITSMIGKQVYATQDLSRMFFVIALSLAIGGTVKGWLPGTKPKTLKKKEHE